MGEPGDEKKYQSDLPESHDAEGINFDADWTAAVHDRNYARRATLQRLDVIIAGLGLMPIPESSKLRQMVQRIATLGGGGTSSVDPELIKAINNNTRTSVALAKQVKDLVIELQLERKERGARLAAPEKDRVWIDNPEEHLVHTGETQSGDDPTPEPIPAADLGSPEPIPAAEPAVEEESDPLSVLG